MKKKMLSIVLMLVVGLTWGIYSVNAQQNATRPQQVQANCPGMQHRHGNQHGMQGQRGYGRGMNPNCPYLNQQGTASNPGPSAPSTPPALNQ